MSFTPAATSGNDIIYGDAQPDLIDALAGDDVIFGGGGDDQLLGGPGNDKLYGESGNDLLMGGIGDDRYEVDRTDTIIEQVDEGTDSIYFRDDSFTGTYFMSANVENLTMVGRFNNVSAFGNGLDNRILGNNTGNDTLNGGAGNDYIQGDFAYYFGSNSFSGNTGSDTIRGGDGNDVIWGDQGEGRDAAHSETADDTLYGDSGNDELHGQSGLDTLYGGSGDDLLDGGGDSDVLYGGAGDDDYLFGRNSGMDQVFETAVAGEANQVRFAVGIGASEVEARREGDDLNFYITGAQNNMLSIVGYYSAVTKPVTEAVFGDGTVWGTAVFDNAAAGPPTDADLVIQGTPGTDTLSGRGGNDTIDGLGSADTIYGGSGNDYLLGEAGDDVLNGGVDNDVIYGGAGNDTLVGDQGVDFLVGGAGNDLLDGGTGLNIYLLQRGDGQDVIRGGTFDSGSEIRLGFYNDETPGFTNRGLLSGEITLTRLNNDLVLSVNGTEDGIRVEDYFANAASGGYPQAEISFQDGTWYTDDINAHVQSGPPPSGTATDGKDTLTGTAGADDLFGRAGDDVISGGAGNDFLNGELGNDLLIGGTGDDMLIVDSGLDVVNERAGEGVDTVQSYVNYTLGGNVENLTLIGDLAISATGNELDNFMVGNGLGNAMLGRSGNDVLYGDGDDDFLNGELGQDQMFGSVGNDTVIVDDLGDYVWEAAGEGTDTVQSHISYALQDNFENLILIGQTGVVAHGNALANVIEGNDMDNQIDGMGGLDRLVGNGGNDRLTLHSGLEEAAGGLGSDALHFGDDLGFLDLAGLAGRSLVGIEAIDLRGGSDATLRLCLEDVLELSNESNTLYIDGDANDQLHIGTGWQRGVSGTSGYDQYTMTQYGEIGVLLVGQSVGVNMGITPDPGGMM